MTIDCVGGLSVQDVIALELSLGGAFHLGLHRGGRVWTPKAEGRAIMSTLGGCLSLARREKARRGMQWVDVPV